MPSRRDAPGPRETPAPDGRARAVIEGISPVVDGGRFAVKRIAGDRVEVEADCFADGHDMLACVLLHRAEGEADWRETPMEPLGNDRWRADFTVSAPGRYRFSVTAWVDSFLSWRHDFARRVDGDDLRVAARGGADLIEAVAQRAGGDDRRLLLRWAERLRTQDDVPALRVLALDEASAAIAIRHPDRTHATTYPVEFPVVVDRERARFSAWYELFPRSCGPVSGAHGTFRDCVERLPYIAGMGFDVLYLPPIHPIGRARRKGRNNALEATASDVGSPWAIGAAEGGHKAIHPGAGHDRRFPRACRRERGQQGSRSRSTSRSNARPIIRTSPRIRPGSGSAPTAACSTPRIRPRSIRTSIRSISSRDDWQALWSELEERVRLLDRRGCAHLPRRQSAHQAVRVLGVGDRPKSSATHPDVLFLAEAFTRPKVMHRLAKLGFSQSYTYFTWRNTKRELTEYFTELTRASRARLLPAQLLAEHAGHPARVPADRRARRRSSSRLVLAATLAANYGIYGPAFELMENEPRGAGFARNICNSEKYELRHWDLARADSLAALIAPRQSQPTRQSGAAARRQPALRFHRQRRADRYTKSTPDTANVVLVVVNLDPHHVQSGWVNLDLAELGIDADRTFQVHDLLTGARYLWQGRATS